MNYKAALFDLDGTLLDTIEDLSDSMNAVLSQLDYPARSVDECKLFVGDGRENFAFRSLPEDHRDQVTVARCVELVQSDYRKRWTTKTRPYDGIAELLEALSDRAVTISVLSNKPDEFVKDMLAHFFPDTDFRIALGVRPGAPTKPDPTVALQIASQLKVAPGEFLYVGDTNTDMQTAVAAGMHAVGVLWGFREAAELTANGAKTLIAQPAELLELL